ncbi:hypothetical protein HDE_10680 [Halotydeus destructor]|nr:hypothetical protein HDE_10680 [Halotydeus destructor]
MSHRSVLDLVYNHEIKLQTIKESAKPDKKVNLIFYVIWLQVCVLVCLYHVSAMTSVYLEYNVQADYTFIPPDKLIPPAFVLCFVRPFRTECEHRNECRYLKTSKLFFDNAYQPEDLLLMVTYLTNSHMVRFNDTMGIKQFFDTAAVKFRYDSLQCFSLNIATNLNISYDRSLFDIHQRPVFLAISLKSKSYNTDNIYTYLLPEMEFVEDLGTRFKAFDQNLGTFHVFSRQEVNLLPSPYKTKCYDYDSKQFKTQEGCINHCRLMSSLRYLRRIPFKLPYYKSDNITYREGKSYSHWEVYQMEKCGRKCSNIDCKIVSYDHWLLEDVNYYNITFTSLSFNAGPQLLVNYKPNLKMSEFAALIGSIECLWLGFSVLSFTKLF